MYILEMDIEEALREASKILLGAAFWGNCKTPLKEFWQELEAPDGYENFLGTGCYTPHQERRIGEWRIEKSLSFLLKLIKLETESNNAEGDDTTFCDYSLLGPICNDKGLSGEFRWEGQWTKDRKVVFVFTGRWNKVLCIYWLGKGENPKSSTFLRMPREGATWVEES